MWLMNLSLGNCGEAGNHGAWRAGGFGVLNAPGELKGQWWIF